MQPLNLYNTLTNKKEAFKPITEGKVGLYVCGPTLYSFVHIGNLRTFISFDILYRYLTHIGYKVRYVRNITDVGHLESDGDEGEDKIAKKARLEDLQPMEVVQLYNVDFKEVAQLYNLLPPSIEPTATGHIVEQIDAVQQMLGTGAAYEVNGSVYFDMSHYTKNHEFGTLSGKNLADLRSVREIKGVEEKRDSSDFALWKKAEASHIMQWTSPWGKGFPGWHLECTCMSTKYLGTQFDIHGGGMDLQFPHHEAEISQGVSLNGVQPANYWLHTNMLTINGEKMSKKKNNSVLPRELITGNHALLKQAYSSMVVRFFMLQAKYNSVLDITNDGLKAAEKGYKRLMNGVRVLNSLSYTTAHMEQDTQLQAEVRRGLDAVYNSMNDDLNTSTTIAHLFDLLKPINQIYIDQLKFDHLGEVLFNEIHTVVNAFVFDILGLREDVPNGQQFADTLLVRYKDAKLVKNYALVDDIRADFEKMGLIVRDTKMTSNWMYDE